MFPFFESMALIEGKIRNLHLHQKRINQTFAYFYPEYKAHDLQNLKFDNINVRHTFSKFKFSYNHSEYIFENAPYQINSIEMVIPFHQPLLDYSFKYSDRLIINRLKTMVPNSAEILIIKNGTIRDTSIHNIIFSDGNEWFTPEEPLLNGTMRQFLLLNKSITERKISLQNLNQFNKFKLINALNSMEDSIAYPIELIKTQKIL
jgi:4-amino-4-deoxychorismate lyase